MPALREHFRFEQALPVRSGSFRAEQGGGLSQLFRISEKIGRIPLFQPVLSAGRGERASPAQDAHHGHVIQPAQVQFHQAPARRGRSRLHQQGGNGVIRKTGILQREIPPGQVQIPHHAVMLAAYFPHESGYGLLGDKIIAEYLRENLDGGFKVKRGAIIAV